MYKCTIVIQCTLKYALHYITCGLRTVYLINLKKLICVDIVKCQVKFCLLPDFFTQISNKFSQHWRAAWNQSAGRGLDSTALGCLCRYLRLLTQWITPYLVINRAYFRRAVQPICAVHMAKCAVQLTQMCSPKIINRGLLDCTSLKY